MMDMLLYRFYMRPEEREKKNALVCSDAEATFTCKEATTYGASFGDGTGLLSMAIKTRTHCVRL